MAVGLPLKTTYADGDVYAASDVNDTNGTINANLNPFTAGKNKIINGDFGVWQRGTSFTTNDWTADRFYFDANGTGSTNTVSRQAFTPGAAPVAGYEGQYFLRMERSAAGSGNTNNTLYIQNIENVQTLAGQTATLSFWAKADSARTVELFIYQNYGSGGSATTGGSIGTKALTTSWARYTITTSIASISGKTVGTSSFLQVLMNMPIGVASTIDVWGFQLEASSTATPFQTATGTLSGELAACQRYYEKSYDQAQAPGGVNNYIGTTNLTIGTATTGNLYLSTSFAVVKRGTPTVTLYDGLGASGKVFKGANGKNASITDIGNRSFRGGTTDATSASELGYHWVAESEL
jgi:hypothetical protein